MFWLRLLAVLAIVGGFLSRSGTIQADDGPAKSSRDVYKEGVAGNEEVERVLKTFPGRGEIGDDSAPTSANDAVKQFVLADGLTMELVAAEPDVMQPLSLHFDPRGRMWVVQYLQYPFPEGLKITRYDQHLRAVFDKVPQPPPHHVPGKDKITVFEDTDQDGKYDTHKDVITGLNIATSVAIGRGGIWVLNPPYLLFFPDANGDDILDADPEVCLSGFGLEDTHSVANSLIWGPDGWLYGANGSTTTGNISSAVTKNVRFSGQCIWRYHPDSKVFEIYAEGGGNTFSSEIDGKGRVFSGTNHGNTRGMYYPQGSYGEKGWGKHGPLTNPYAFGYFLHMRHEGDKDRFPQTFVIYEGDQLPRQYHATVIAANALHNRVWASEVFSDTSTYRTVDLPPLVTTPDRWFRPVDVKVGPDGAVYIADWYDTRLTHVDPRDNWHKTSGRVYRLLADGRGSMANRQKEMATDLTKLSDDELVGLFSHPNKWQRQTAVRVLGERQNPETLAKLKTLLVERPSSESALEALWAVNLLGGFDFELAAKLLANPDQHVRRWTIRLLGDQRRLNDPLGTQLVEVARTEPYVQVRSQLASTAKRIESKYALPIIRELVARDEDRKDLHMPLLNWWAMEGHAEDRNAVALLLTDASFWKLPMVREQLLGRIMQRYALAGTAEDLAMCTSLMDTAPDQESRKLLMSGFMAAYQGREIANLPPALAKAINEYQKSLGESDLSLALKLGKPEAADEAIKLLQNPATEPGLRVLYAELLGELKLTQAVGPLLGLLSSDSIPLKKAVLRALMNFDDPRIGETICSRYQSTLPDELGLRGDAQRVLASRAEWTKQLLREIEEYRIEPKTVSLDIVQQMRLHADDEIQKQLDKHWGKTRATPEEKKQQIDRVRRALLVKQAEPANPFKGQALFKQHCATCHTLFNEGGQTGPNLTGYERANLDFMLLAIVDPSAAIREEFTQYQIATHDGRILTGLINQQSPTTITLRGVNNQTTLINKSEVEVLQAMSTSIMPDGLMEKLNDQELRDLFSYTTARTPPR